MVINTDKIMLAVIAALLPGVTAMIVLWGWGILWNIALLTILCGLIEIICGCLKYSPAISQIQVATGQSSTTQLVLQQCKDFSWLVTAWLIALCLPPFTSLGVLICAALGAIALAKHAYGGLGHNVFNPAMVGYAIVLISFPSELTQWPELYAQSSLQAASDTTIDGYSGATLLTEFRYRQGLTVFEFEQQHAEVMAQNELTTYAFLLGGTALIYLRLIAWRVPLGIALGVILAAIVGQDQGSSEGLGGAWLHMSTGGLAVAAFFVATDPVTHPNAHKYQLIFGLGIGLLIYLIRNFGVFPDGIAFAILLANCTTPLLNRIHISKQQAPQGTSKERQQGQDKEKLRESNSGLSQGHD